MTWPYTSFYLDRYPKELHPRLRLGDPTLVYLGSFFLQDYLNSQMPWRQLPDAGNCLVGELLDPSECTPAQLRFLYRIRILGRVDFNTWFDAIGAYPTQVSTPSEPDIPYIAFTNLQDYTEPKP